MKTVAGAFMTFVNKLCAATQRQAVYIAPLDLFLMSSRVATSVLQKEVYADKSNAPMPSLKNESTEPDLPVSAQYDYVTIQTGTAMKNIQLRTRGAQPLAAFVADGKVANNDFITTANDITLHNPYILYSEDENDESLWHFIDMSPLNPVVIFIRENPRRVIDGSIRCIVRPPIGWSRTLLDIQAAMHAKRVDATPTALPPIDGDGDDDDSDDEYYTPQYEPPGVARRKTNEPTAHTLLLRHRRAPKRFKRTTSIGENN
jgi:hypothetical protein